MNKSNRMSPTLFSCLVGILFLLVFTDCSNNEKMCVVNNVSLNEISPYYDGQWQGITVASDGACYFGSSAHNLIHGGGFLKFNPKTGSVEIIAEDLTNLVGDDMAKFTPQGKIHSPIIEIDGELFLATHLAAYWNEVLDKYAGSYFLSYNIHTKEWDNYGIVKERFSTYSAIEVDKKRGKAYTMTVPFAPEDLAEGNHMFEIDLKTKEKRDLGRLGSGKASFYFYLDDIGRVWTPTWLGAGSLYCYDPAVDSIMEYKNAFPEPKLMNGENIAVDPFFKEYSWTWARSIDDGEKCLFTMGDFGGGDERLWLFDPHEDINSKEAFTPICYIGNTFLSVALAGNRLYFIQQGDNELSRKYNSEGNRDLPPDKNGFHVNDLHLKSVSLDPDKGYKIIDHGKLIDEKGRTAAYIGSLAADESGNVYMSGSWLIKDGDQPSLQFIYVAPDGKRYGPLEHPGQENSGADNQSEKSDDQFIELKRGEFFSWVNVSKDFQ